MDRHPQPTSAADDGDASALHQALVDGLKGRGLLPDSRVEDAFRAAPRHLFLPGVPPRFVYRDEAITTKHFNNTPISSSSQPSMMAAMLAQLDLQPGHNVLEIGAATGYNAALMAHIVGEKGEVTTLDIDADIVTRARENLDAAGFKSVRVIHADGGHGYPTGGPYDRIILTVASWDIAPAWEEQLKPDGRLLLPLSIIGGGQKTVLFERATDHLVSASTRDCIFMTLRGAFAEPENSVQLGPSPGLQLLLKGGGTAASDAQATYELLTGPAVDLPTGVKVTPPELLHSLSPWLSIHLGELCLLSARGELTDRGIVPPLVGHAGQFCSTGGLIHDGSMAMLTRPPGQSLPHDPSKPEPPFELFVRGYGPDDSLARRMIKQIMAWHAHGRRSGLEHVSVKAYPKDSGYTPSSNEVVSERRWTRLVFSWE